MLMINQDQFIGSIAHNTQVITHLMSKITPDELDYRPGENMRTMLELLQYLTVCGIGPARSLIEGSWDVAQGLVAAANELKFGEIQPALENQLEDMTSLIKGVSQEDLETKQIEYPWGGSEPLGAALVNTAYTFMSAYRLQLFTYVKASGQKDLNTMNAWLGQDVQIPS